MRNLSPVNFHRYGQDFLRAARREFEESKVAISIPAYFLASRAIELSLKSFLLLKGKSETDLRRISHDLEKGLDAATNEGLGEVVQLSDREEAALRWINQYYVKKDLEYVTTGFKSYPEPGAVLECAEALSNGLASAVRRWRPEDDGNGR